MSAATLSSSKQVSDGKLKRGDEFVVELDFEPSGSVSDQSDAVGDRTR